MRDFAQFELEHLTVFTSGVTEKLVDWVSSESDTAISGGSPDLRLPTILPNCNRQVSYSFLGSWDHLPVDRFARWVHVVLHRFRLEEEHSFRETENRLAYMAEIRDVLGLDRDYLPDYSTIY